MSWITNIFKRGDVKNATLKEPEWWRQVMVTGKTGSGVYVNEGNALNIAAVYACVRVISETIAGLPLKVYRRTDSGRQAIDHPLQSLFNGSPNNIQTSFELMEFVASSLCLRGNNYNQRVLDNRGNVAEINPLLAQYMAVDQDASGRLVFDYSAPGESRTFRQDEIWRVAGLSSNGITGLSPIGLARESFGLAMASESSAAHMYSNGAQIPGVLEFPDRLDEEIIKKLREQWADNHGGPENAHKPLILESGMKYSQIGMNAKDAQFLEARKFQISEIARWYRVPLHKLGELDRATFSNIEHQSIEFVIDTILPWCRRLEQSIQRDLLSTQEKASGVFVRFNLEGLLRGDTQTRFEAYGKAINDGWLSRNEVRAMENHNPVDGLDEYLVPLNMSGASNPDARVSNWLATREINALNNCSKENSEKWAEDFYSRHAETLHELTGLTKDKCAQYAIDRINTLKTQGISASKTSAIASLKEALCHE